MNIARLDIALALLAAVFDAVLYLWILPLLCKP